MLKTANLHIRIDPETKSGAEELFSTFGITVSDAVIMFLRQSLLVGGLPFELRQPRYNAETEAAIQEARDIMDGKVHAKTYYSVAEMHADIDAEDE
ncbi:MAG: type II toxin-antitoxin system RelB/DinJ family antitoxin [Defluviitaleaceae bacterium]|nr:type II toxin-antitoxin system RelB/DinJ family antitoxin [Defluviitaleaceae bacterium]